jgi:hypothetical protein
MSELLERFLSNREGLSADELTRLADEVRQDPRLAAEARSLLQVDELLSRKHSLDRGHFAARVAKRLATVESGTFVRRMQPITGHHGQQGWHRVGLAAAAVFAVFIGGWTMLHRGESTPVSVVSVSVDGAVTRAGKLITNGAQVTPGDMLHVTAGLATLMWDDGTSIRLSAGTQVRLGSVDPKRLSMETGALEADVAQQPADRLMTLATRDALTTVLGTRFRLTCGRGTRLDVWEGRVAFSHGGATIPVAAGEMADSSSGEQPRAWPRNIQIAFGSSDDQQPAPGTFLDQGEAFSAERGYGWERAQDGGAYPGVEWKGAPRTSDRQPAGRWNVSEGRFEKSGLSVGWAGYSDAWRLRLPDGRYQLTIVVGGCPEEQGPHRVLAQGQTVVADLITDPDQLVECSMGIEVTDGWLRLEVGGTTAPPAGDGSSDTIICRLRLSPLE